MVHSGGISKRDHLKTLDDILINVWEISTHSLAVGSVVLCLVFTCKPVLCVYLLENADTISCILCYNKSFGGLYEISTGQTRESRLHSHCKGCGLSPVSLHKCLVLL